MKNWNRRECLAAMGALALQARGQDYRIKKADIRLGIASYSLRKFGRSDAIRIVKELGTPYLNVKDVHLALDSTADQISGARAEFQAGGIKLVGCGNVSFAKDDDADIRSKFEYAKRAGFPLIVCAPTHTTLPKLEPLVREFDIKIAVHNHGPEDKNFPTPESVLEAVKSMDPRCGLCMDVGHTARTGADPAEWVRKAGPRLLDMHVKDLKDVAPTNHGAVVGEGVLPIKQILTNLVAINYVGSVNLEYELKEDDPVPGMHKSMDFLRQILGAMQSGRSSS